MHIFARRHTLKNRDKTKNNELISIDWNYLPVKQCIAFRNLQITLLLVLVIFSYIQSNLTPRITQYIPFPSNQKGENTKMGVLSEKKGKMAAMDKTFMKREETTWKGNKVFFRKGYFPQTTIAFQSRSTLQMYLSFQQSHLCLLLIPLFSIVFWCLISLASCIHRYFLNIHVSFGVINLVLCQQCTYIPN